MADELKAKGASFKVFSAAAERYLPATSGAGFRPDHVCLHFCCHCVVHPADRLRQFHESLDGTFAEPGRRGIRKVFGANRKILIVQFLSEAIVLVPWP